MDDRTADLAPGASASPKRFVWSLSEASGALGDLGTFLPHIIGAITVVGMNPTGVFVAFGLFYIFTGSFYGLPIAVQPMKAASAAILIQPMDPGSVAGAGLIIGLVFLLLGSTGVVGRLARALPDTVAAGLQLGLGLSLAWLGVRMIQTGPWLGVAIAGLMLALMRFPRAPGALAAIGIGVAAGQLFHLAPPIPRLELGLHLPQLIWPTWPQLLNGVDRAVLPQIPLTLTNAIVVTAALSRDLFPGGADRVSERNLALTTGIGNLLAAPFGGYMMCHGAGGLAGHVRFGARTGAAPVMIGLLFLALGLLLGRAGYDLLRAIPQPVLGSLLFFSGLELALSARPGRFQSAELFLVLLIGVVGIAVNPAVAFLLGAPLAFALKHQWLKF